MVWMTMATSRLGVACIYFGRTVQVNVEYLRVIINSEGNGPAAASQPSEDVKSKLEELDDGV